MAKIGKSRVWGRSYTTIPVAVRNLLEVDNGDDLEWFFIEGKIIIKKGSNKNMEEKSG